MVPLSFLSSTLLHDFHWPNLTVRSEMRHQINCVEGRRQRSNITCRSLRTSRSLVSELRGDTRAYLLLHRWPCCCLFACSFQVSLLYTAVDNGRVSWILESQFIVGTPVLHSTHQIFDRTGAALISRRPCAYSRRVIEIMHWMEKREELRSCCRFKCQPMKDVVSPFPSFTFSPFLVFVCFRSDRRGLS